MADKKPQEMFLELDEAAKAKLKSVIAMTIVQKKFGLDKMSESDLIFLLQSISPAL